MDNNGLNHIDSFVNSTRDVVYLRDIDRLLIIRPNKIQHLNETAFNMLHLIYNMKSSAEDTIRKMAEKYGVEKGRLKNDLVKLTQSINAIMKEDYAGACMVDTIPFNPESIKYPVLSEIALTYSCQNNCDFCYASSPYRGERSSEMKTDDIKKIIHKISDEAHVPTISFTGGEPTLRKDLPALIEFAHGLGMRTNLITNGIKCSNNSFVEKLKKSGLDSAQVSLESHREDIHNDITGNSSAYKNTIKGIHNLKNAGIYTHTNTTICLKNMDHLKPLARFIKDEFDFSYLSMNMVIKTGIARDNGNVKINYTSIGDIIRPVIIYCESMELKFVWYSPTPYCIFNPVDHNLGSKSCACISGLLSVNPGGEILPCSSYDRGVGNLLNHSFDYIWNSDEALYFREKRYLPPVCSSCDYDELCGGACPLYWENEGCFDEIENISHNRYRLKNILWSIENKLRVKAKGVKGLKAFRRDTNG
ncbi:radical SAM protein [Spirochaetota bacterium]